MYSQSTWPYSKSLAGELLVQQNLVFENHAEQRPILQKMPESNHGVVGAIDRNSLPNVAPIIIFSTIALISSIELAGTVVYRFRNRRGLYFYTLFVSAWGVIIFSVGLNLKFFALGPVQLGYFMLALGWSISSNGQSMVLYSRLHLVVLTPKTIKWVLIMILSHAVLTNTLLWVFFYLVCPLSFPIRLLSDKSRIEFSVSTSNDTR
jgi:hypothetical protein